MPGHLNIDRSHQPGRLRLTFALGGGGSLVREPIWGYDFEKDEPVITGPGLNVSALGTLSAPELRALAAVLQDEATSIEAVAKPGVRDHWDHRAKDGE